MAAPKRSNIQRAFDELWGSVSCTKKKGLTKYDIHECVGTGEFFLDEEKLQSFSKKICSKRPDALTEGYVKDITLTFVARLHLHEGVASAEESVAEILKETVDKKFRSEIFLPIEDVVLRIRKPWVLGNLTIKNVTNASATKFSTQITSGKAKVRFGGHYGAFIDESRRSLGPLSRWYVHYYKKFGGLPCVVVSTDKSVGSSVSYALEKAYFFIDAFMFLYHENMKTCSDGRMIRQIQQMGIAGYYAKNTQAKILISDGTDLYWKAVYGERDLLKGSQFSGRHTMEINRKIADELTKKGLEYILKLFDAQEDGTATPVECALVRAIQWFANAQRAFTTQEKIINATICIECLLNIDKGQEIVKSVSEAAALLLKDDYASREVVRKVVAKNYSYRSHLVHGEHLDMRQTDTNELLAVSKELICKFMEIVQGGIKDFNEVKQLLLKLKFS